MTFQIREATPEDAPIIHTLILELAEYEKMHDEAAAGSDPEALRRHLSPEAGPRVEAFLAELPEGEIAGFALCYQHYSTFQTNWGIYLEDLFVRPSRRGHGIGLALMRTVAGLAVERGAARLEWQVLDWNESAITFYRRLGAEAMREWTTMRLSGSSLRALGAL